MHDDTTPRRLSRREALIAAATAGLGAAAYGARGLWTPDDATAAECVLAPRSRCASR